MSALLVRPSSKLDFNHDWTGWLAGGDSIATHNWSITPLGPTILNATAAAVVVSGFTAGEVYRLKENIVTATGLEEVRDVVIRCLR